MTVWSVTDRVTYGTRAFEEVLGLRIFRWTENMETAVPTDHPSDFLVYDADLLSWPVAF